MQRTCLRSLERVDVADDGGTSIALDPAMNAIDLLLKQHRQTKEALEKICEGELDETEMRLAADELVAHMVIEEHVFYPRVRALDPSVIGESFEEHAVARFELARLMLAEGEEKTARANVLKELVEHHIEEEEKELLPKVRAKIRGAELEALGERMEGMFERAVEAGLEKLVVGDAQELRAIGQNGARGRDKAAPRPQAARTSPKARPMGSRGMRATRAPGRATSR